jgi:uncharacterized membrane protein
VKKRRGLALVLAAAAAFAGAQIWIGIWRYDIYRAGVDDGIFTQVVLSAGGCFCAAAEGWANHFLVHFSPMLIVGYPFVKAFGDARGLLVLQALLVSTTAFPLYAIARRYVDDVRAAAIAAVAMIYPVLWAQTFTDFHENAFVPVLSATLVLFILTRRWRAAGVTALLLLLVKEDQTVMLALTGILTAIWGARKDVELRRFGLLLAAGAVVTGILYFGVIRPAFHSNVPYVALNFFDWSASAPGTVGAAPAERLTYLLLALVPLVFLPLRSRAVIFAIPGLLEVLASHYHVMLVLQTHYSMVWSGYMLAAFSDAAANLVAKQPRSGVRALALACVACALTFRLAHPVALRYYLYREPDADDARLARVLSSVPRDATVSGSDEIYAHLAARPGAAPGVLGDYYVADSKLDDPTWSQRDKAVLDAAVKAGRYRIVYDRFGIIVAKKSR